MPAPAAPAPFRLTALVAGGSGLVGAQLLRAFAAAPEFTRVLAVTRRPLSYDHPKLVNRIVRFETLEQSLQGTTADVAFCCLGSTLAAAGSQAAFRAIDHDLVVAFARAARNTGAKRLVLVSSVGADPASKHFYLRVKGETEAAVALIGFPSLDIMQPGLLLGARGELRLVELLGRGVMPLVNPLLIGVAERFRAIPASTVAAAMIGVTRMARKGIYRYTHRGMQELARTGAPSPRRRS